MGLDGEHLFDQVVVWFEHLPILLLLLFPGITSLARASKKKKHSSLT